MISEINILLFYLKIFDDVIVEVRSVYFRLVFNPTQFINNKF